MAPTAEIYIELVVGFPEDPKVRGLLRHGPDARGLRDLYVQMALYCKRNLSDGFVPEEEVGILVYPDSWENGLRDAERLVQARLLEKVDGGYIVLAFAKRNRTKAEVIRLTEEKAAGGALGNHRRWHKNGVVKADCIYCQSDTDRTTDSDATRTTDRGSDSGSESHLPSGTAQEAVGDGGEAASAPADDVPGMEGDEENAHVNRSDRTTDRTPTTVRSPETETETETETEEKNPPSPQGGKRRKRRVGAEDYDSDPDFVRFWDVFPVKGGKVDAFKAWQSAVARGDNPELIIRAAEWFRDDPKRDSEHTKWAQGWLNGRRYKEQKPTQAGGGGGWWNN